MSSLQATQADGYYLPPAYYESQNGKQKPLSKNQWYASQHNNHSSSNSSNRDGVVVRFELPYSALCLHCGAHVSRGSRFHAHKRPVAPKTSKIPVWEFTMTCRYCAVQSIVIRTDPAAQAFVYVSGLQRLSRNDSVFVATQNETTTANTAAARDTVVERLEHEQQEAQFLLSEHDQLQTLQQMNRTVYQDDAASNAALRCRRRLVEQQKQQQQPRIHGTTIPLLPAAVQDQHQALEMTFGNGQRSEAAKFKRVRSSSIFAAAAVPQTRKRQRKRHDATLNNADEKQQPPRPDTVFSSSRNSSVLTTTLDATTTRRPNDSVVDDGTTLDRNTTAAAATTSFSNRKVVRRMLVSGAGMVRVATTKQNALATDALSVVVAYSSDSD